MTEKQKLNIAAIGVMYLLFFVIAFVTNFAGSMGVIATNQFGASNAMAQLGTLATFIAYAVMGIPAGMILRRKGYKFTGLLAISVGIIGVGIQWYSGIAGSFGVYVLGAFVAGFCLCLLDTVVNPMLNTLGGGGKRGNQLIQFGGVCNSIGGTLTPIILGLLIGGNIDTACVSDIAPAMIAAIVMLALAFVLILICNIPEPHIETKEQRAARLADKDPIGPLSFRHCVLGAIAAFCYAGVELGVPNTANLYMSNNPMVGPAAAGTMVGVFWLCMMIGRLIGGTVGGRIPSRVMLATVSSISIIMLSCILFFPETWTIAVAGAAVPVSMAIMSLCGLMTSVMWGTIFNLSVEGLGKYTPAATGIFMTLVCGGGIMPFFQNLLADHTNYLVSFIVPILGLAYILFYALVGSKPVMPKQ